VSWETTGSGCVVWEVARPPGIMIFSPDRDESTGGITGWGTAVEVGVEMAIGGGSDGGSGSDVERVRTEGGASRNCS